MWHHSMKHSEQGSHQRSQSWGPRVPLGFTGGGVGGRRGLTWPCLLDEKRDWLDLLASFNAVGSGFGSKCPSFWSAPFQDFFFIIIINSLTLQRENFN